MIKKINLAKLVATELYQFFSLIIGIADAANPTVSKIKPERDALNGFLPRLQAAIYREKVFALTKVLQVLDDRRDMAIVGFAMWVSGLAKHPKKPTKDAAAVIKSYLDTHCSNIYSQNYQAESTILSKIVEDYGSNAALKTAVDGLGGKDWIDEIGTANTDFIATYQQRSADMGVDANAESFYSLRAPAMLQYTNFTDMLVSRYKTALADGLDTSLLKKCMDDINATVAQYQQLIEATKVVKVVAP